MSRHPKVIREAYNEVLDRLEKQRVIEDVPFDDRENRFYIPHHPVIRQDKDSSKVRLVLNCAQKFGGTSLNDHIDSGSNPVQDLVGILLAFRTGEFTLTADVKEMFLQVRMRPEDSDFHRILVKKNERFVPFRFRVFPFGNTCSPKVAITIAKQNAKRFQSKYPQASRSIQEFTLVDDTLRSMNNEKELEKLGKDLVFIYDQIGMDLRKFASNSKRVMESIPIEKRAPSINMHKFHHNVESIYNKTTALGMIWICDSDLLQYKIKDLNLEQ